MPLPDDIARKIKTRLVAQWDVAAHQADFILDQFAVETEDMNGRNMPVGDIADRMFDLYLELDPTKVSPKARKRT